MIEVHLTPSGNLRWSFSEEPTEEKRFNQLQSRFEADWREGLFILAAKKMEVTVSPTLAYWQGIAESLLTRLCHLHADMTPDQIEPPSEAECAQWLLTAPPMTGGEYLSEPLLKDMWHSVATWCVKAADAEGGLHSFLGHHAPKWRQVGRVCLHLAENKSDPNRPFAFMATYISGLSSAGQARHLPLGRALEQYAGAKNKSALVKLLAPVQAASERCVWVKELVDNRTIYRPMGWTPDQAYQFLLSVPCLEESGLMVRLPDWWRRRPKPRVAVTLGHRQPSRFGLESVLDFDVAAALGDKQLTKDEVQELLDGGDGLVLFKGQWIEVDRDKLQTALAHWESLCREADGSISFIEGMRLLAGTASDLREEKHDESARDWVHIDAGPALREILAGLRDPSQLSAPVDGNLKATLRPYQRDGVAWLRFLTGLGLGACLADDMGLGKTMQVLALLLGLRASGKGPSLLVAPASLLGNWHAEAARFASSLRLSFLHPSETESQRLTQIAQAPARELADTDLAVTTYSMLARQPWLNDVDWQLIILDEAQAIKNPGTRQTRTVKKLAAGARLALTGTPIENRLGDLWSLFDFLNPGLLGSAAVFKSFVNDLEQRESNQYAPLRRLVAPYILRRLKTDRTIINDLPDKVETTRYCTLTTAQVRLYEQVVKSMKTALKASDGMKRRALVLQTLTRLKQVCNHPSQLTGDGVYDPGDSGKFQRLLEICEELAERQERLLIFTQFREIIAPIASCLAVLFRRPGLVLHGQTSVSKRRRLVEQFQDEDGPPFMILSLKAGGTGLNLTAASHVVHFDRWWNPAVEDQATDRAFRIGQHKNVLVHKFVTSGSVEEKIDMMIADKRQLAEELLSGEREVDITSLDDNALMDLVRLDIRRAVL